MESTDSKTAVIKPLLLKAGIPMVISVVGFAYARIIARNIGANPPSSLETRVSSHETINSCHEELTDEASDHNLKYTSSPIKENKEKMMESYCPLSPIEKSEDHDEVNVEEEVLSLRNRTEELRNREWELEKQFLCFHSIKEQESVLVEIRNMMSSEIARVEFLARELSSMETDKQRFENLLVEYLNVLQQLEFTKQENGLLQRKLKKLSRKRKEQTLVIREKNSKLEAAEAEILRCCEAIDTMTNAIRKLEDEIRELHTIVNQLQEGKNQHLARLNSEEHSAPPISKIKEEHITKEDYNHLLNELKQLQNDRVAEATELAYLRWTNACLRHELTRNRGVQEEIEDRISHLEQLELEGSREFEDQDPEQQHHDSAAATGGQACPKKKKKLIQKLKRWVEGGESMKTKLDEKEKHESKCSGRHVSGHIEEEQLIHARSSFASA